MSFMFSLLRPALHALDAETAHGLTVKALASGLTPRLCVPKHKNIEQTLWGLNFKNPVGMAAGFDKNAQALGGLFACGFGFVEAGTVTPEAQEGNPRPRIFREPTTQSVINRMGFPGEGADVFEKNYAKFRTRDKKNIVGINIGKNKATQDAAADYLTLIERFGAGADYLTINISSPNTPGLRTLQGRTILLPLLNALVAKRDEVCGTDRKTPLLVKLAPDLEENECEDIAQVVMEAGIDGLVLSNTTLARPDTLPSDFSAQTGGLSGPLLRDKSTAIIARFYKLTQGKLPIIGVGGISSGLDAYAKIRSGASLVQLYTALVYQGPTLVTHINRDLIALLTRDGFENIQNAVGVDA